MNTGRATNPFSSHLVDPERGGFIFSGNESACNLEQIIERLDQYSWRGELVGAKGAGKSTLMTDICSGLRQRGLRVVRWQCNDRQRSLPTGWHRDIKEYDIIAIDGAERLWPWLLLTVRAETRVLGKGFLITTHRKIGIGATLPVTAGAASLAEKVHQLTGQWVPTAEIEQRLNQHRGNAREVLFDLYMEHER